MRQRTDRFAQFGYPVLHGVLLTVAAIYIFSFAYLPLQDLPQWIYQGHVFNQIVFHGFDFNGFFSLHGYVPPNASATVLIAVFELVTTPEVAGKLFLLLSVVLIYLGSWRLLVVLTRMQHPLFCIVALTGSFNLLIILGLMNFLFGLGIALIGAAYIVRRGKSVNYAVLGLLFFICYCSHFASLVILCIPVGAMLFQHRRDRKVLIRVGLAAVPTLLVFVQYFATKDLQTFSPSGILDRNYFASSINIYKLFPAVVMPFHRIKDVYDPASVAEVSNYLFAILVHIGAAYFIVRMLLTKETTMQSLMGLLTAGLIIVSPPYFGGLFFLGERFVYLFWLILVAFYFVQCSNPRLRIVFSLCAIALLISTVVSLWQSTQTFNALGNFRMNEHSIDAGEQWGSSPFEHVHFYRDAELNRPVPVSGSGLVTYVGANTAKPF